MQKLDFLFQQITGKTPTLFAGFLCEQEKVPYSTRAERQNLSHTKRVLNSLSQCGKNIAAEDYIKTFLCIHFYRFWASFHLLVYIHLLSYIFSRNYYNA